MPKILAIAHMAPASMWHTPKNTLTCKKIAVIQNKCMVSVTKILIIFLTASFSTTFSASLHRNLTETNQMILAFIETRSLRRGCEVRKVAHFNHVVAISVHLQIHEFLQCKSRVKLGFPTV